MWGATLVSATTSIMWDGFEVIKKINKGIKKVILSSFRGSLQAA